MHKQTDSVPQSNSTMDKTIRRFASHEEQELETLRYWQSRTPGERFIAVWEATVAGYAFKGIHCNADQRSARTITRVERTKR